MAQPIETKRDATGMDGDTYGKEPLQIIARKCWGQNREAVLLEGSIGCRKDNAGARENQYGRKTHKKTYAIQRRNRSSAISEQIWRFAILIYFLVRPLI